MIYLQQKNQPVYPSILQMNTRSIMKRTLKHNSAMRLLPLIVLIVISCDQPKNRPATNEKTGNSTDSVNVFILAKDSAKKVLSLPGELHPNENAQIRSKAQGYIKKLNVDIGSKVRKGQVLAL